MGRITTHVLDIAQGQPAAGVGVTLYRVGDDDLAVAASVFTNADGRTDEPLLEGDAFTPGSYELVFAIGDYYRSQGAMATGTPFLTEAVVRFTVTDAADDYHLPLLATPWSWTTYRGS